MADAEAHLVRRRGLGRMRQWIGGRPVHKRHRVLPTVGLGLVLHHVIEHLGEPDLGRIRAFDAHVFAGIPRLAGINNVRALGHRRFQFASDEDGAHVLRNVKIVNSAAARATWRYARVAVNRIDGIADFSFRLFEERRIEEIASRGIVDPNLLVESEPSAIRLEVVVRPVEPRRQQRVSAYYPRPHLFGRVEPVGVFLPFSRWGTCVVPGRSRTKVHAGHVKFFPAGLAHPPHGAVARAKTQFDACRFRRLGQDRGNGIVITGIAVQIRQRELRGGAVVAVVQHAAVDIRRLEVLALLDKRTGGENANVSIAAAGSQHFAEEFRVDLAAPGFQRHERRPHLCFFNARIDAQHAVKVKTGLLEAMQLQVGPAQHHDRVRGVGRDLVSADKVTQRQDIGAFLVGSDTSLVVRAVLRLPFEFPETDQHHEHRYTDDHAVCEPEPTIHVPPTPCFRRRPCALPSPICAARLCSATLPARERRRPSAGIRSFR